MPIARTLRDIAVTELGYKTYSADLSPSAWQIWC
jgi:hypothetical protein